MTIISAQLLANISAVIVKIASWICIISVLMSGTGVSFTYPQMKESIGVMSGVRVGGGGAAGPLRPIQRLGKVSSGNYIVLENQCGSAPSCLKITHSGFFFEKLSLTVMR